MIVDIVGRVKATVPLHLQVGSLLPQPFSPSRSPRSGEKGARILGAICVDTNALRAVAVADFLASGRKPYGASRQSVRSVGSRPSARNRCYGACPEGRVR